jgi:hypothetical protein
MFVQVIIQLGPEDEVPRPVDLGDKIKAALELEDDDQLSVNVSAQATFPQPGPLPTPE